MKMVGLGIHKLAAPIFALALVGCGTSEDSKLSEDFAECSGTLTAIDVKLNYENKLSDQAAAFYEAANKISSDHKLTDRVVRGSKLKMLTMISIESDKNGTNAAAKLINDQLVRCMALKNKHPNLL